ACKPLSMSLGWVALPIRYGLVTLDGKIRIRGAFDTDFTGRVRNRRQTRREGSSPFNNGEALEERRAFVEILVLSGVSMRLTEVFRPCPCGEVILCLPERVRGIERIALLGIARTAQKMETDKARHFGQTGIPVLPERLEGLFGPRGDLEAIHRNEHARPPD